MESRDKEEEKKKLTELNTFPTPFPLDEIKENISISTNIPSKLFKEELINQAIQFHLKGNISEAEKKYKYLLEKGIIEEKLFSNYGSLLIDSGKTKEGIKYLQKAIEINPHKASNYYTLGKVFSQSGKIQEAEKYIKKAIKIEPNEPNYLLLLAAYLNNLEKTEEAISCYKKILKLRPWSILASNYLAYNDIE